MVALSLGKEATMKLRMIGARRAQPPWRRALARMREPRATEIEQEEEHSFDAMLHWHDPVERARTHHRSHTLVDDNPASG